MAIYRLPFDNSHGGWSLAVGNYDDPVGGRHGLGQAFAWDFSYKNADDPDGAKWGKIYAARAGTVIDLRDGVTAVLSASDPLLGPGNYILIRHADNTISAYDHLKVNSIRVTVHQYVEQGAWLATVGNTGSTSGGVVHLHFDGSTWLTVNKIGDPTSLVAGASLLVHFEDRSHTAWRPVVGDSFGANPLQYRQDGWRFCQKCAGLYFSYQDNSGVCPAGGPHATSGGNYTLTDDANAPGQANWKYCRKCAGLFFAGNPGSKCPVKTPTSAHDGTASNSYRIINNVQNDPGQHHWRWCSKCQGMWFGDATTSICPGNAGGPHSQSNSGDYSLALNPEEIQQNWRWCNRCQGLFYAPNGAGVCKAGSGGHSATGSANYTLCVDVSPVNSTGKPQNSVPPNATGWQAGWRYCNKCGLLWMGSNLGAHCPKGGTHSSSGSGNYYLCINDAGMNSALGQVGWRWCSKCQGLWMGLNSGSRCSADGLPHSYHQSGKYVLSFDND